MGTEVTQVLKDLRNMNSNRFAVFAASLQWADAMKVVSRGTPRSRTSVTWGIRWSKSASEKDGERRGRFPTVRHAHLLGLIGRSHFSAHAQAEESEERRWLDWDRGNSIFTPTAIQMLSNCVLSNGVNRILARI